MIPEIAKIGEPGMLLFEREMETRITQMLSGFSKNDTAIQQQIAHLLSSTMCSCCAHKRKLSEKALECWMNFVSICCETFFCLSTVKNVANSIYVDGVTWIYPIVS